MAGDTCRRHVTVLALLTRRDIAFDKEVRKDVCETMTITFIYSRPALLFIVLNIVKEKEVKPVDITDINGLAFSLNIYR
jgi:hypothetical protein